MWVPQHLEWGLFLYSDPLTGSPFLAFVREDVLSPEVISCAMGWGGVMPRGILPSQRRMEVRGTL